MSKAVKTLICDELKSTFSRVDAGIVIGIRGLDAAHMHNLRGTLRKKKAHLTVVKNALARRALLDLGLPATIDTVLEGQVGVAHGEGTEAPELAKTITEWSKKNKDKIEIRGGFLEKSVLGARDVTDLASMPSRQQMLGMFVGTLQAPIGGLVNALAGTIRNLVGTLDAIKDKKAAAGGGEPPAAAAVPAAV